MESQLGRAGADYREVWQEAEQETETDLCVQVRRWRQCVSRVEPLASLLFGLELRLEVNTPGLGRYESLVRVLILHSIEEEKVSSYFTVMIPYLD